MQDRQSLLPKRISLTDDDGNITYATWDYADQPVVEGTPLVKDTFLKDTTAAALGLDPDDDPSVDDALNAVVPITRTVNGKALSANVVLAASDVGAAKTSVMSAATLLAASWSGTNVVTAETNVSDGAVEADADAFAEAVSGEAGTYTFAYDGTNAYWTLGAAEVLLAEYGVTLTGTPANADIVTVVYAVDLPNTCTLAVTGVTATSAVEILPALTITAEQQEALQGLSLLDGGQEAGSITLKTFMEKPEIDLPIRVIVRGDL